MLSQSLGRDWLSQPAARLMAGFFGALYFASIVTDPELRGRSAVAALIFGLLLLGAIAALIRDRQTPYALLALTGGSLGMGWVAPHSAGGAAIYAVIGLLASRYDLRGAPAAAAVGLAALLELEALNPAKDPTGPALQALAMALTFVATLSARRNRDQAERAREAEFERARTDERARMAREMHDVLAHSLTALTVQLDLARALLQHDPSDPQALATVDRAHSLARQGLDEARRAVSALRGDAVPGLDELPHLAEQFEADTGVKIEVAVPSALPDLSSEERVAIYRVAQEALTNIRRHAAARRVVMRVSADDGGVALTVENDGGSKPSLHSGGFGLTGMRERAELLGGRLEAGPTTDGYRVRLWLPA